MDGDGWKEADARERLEDHPGLVHDMLFPARGAHAELGMDDTVSSYAAQPLALLYEALLMWPRGIFAFIVLLALFAVGLQATDVLDVSNTLDQALALVLSLFI